MEAWIAFGPGEERDRETEMGWDGMGWDGMECVGGRAGAGQNKIQIWQECDVWYSGGSTHTCSKGSAPAVIRAAGGPGRERERERKNKNTPIPSPSSSSARRPRGGSPPKRGDSKNLWDLNKAEPGRARGGSRIREYARSSSLPCNIPADLRGEGDRSVGPRPAAHFLNPRAGGAITPDTTRQSPKTRTGLEVGVSDVVARVGQISPSRLPTKTRRSKRSKRTKDERGGGSI